jgi:outer membrane protein OmpA-like peptidoglycan-associated protein
MVIEVKSYTDCRGTKSYNTQLSRKRADVTEWYIKSRISGKGRTDGKGLGETNLTDDCACEGTLVSTCSESEFQLDRRSEFIVVSK